MRAPTTCIFRSSLSFPASAGARTGCISKSRILGPPTLFEVWKKKRASIRILHRKGYIGVMFTHLIIDRVVWVLASPLSMYTWLFRPPVGIDARLLQRLLIWVELGDQSSLRPNEARVTPLRVDIRQVAPKSPERPLLVLSSDVRRILHQERKRTEIRRVVVRLHLKHIENASVPCLSYFSTFNMCNTLVGGS